MQWLQLNMDMPDKRRFWLGLWNAFQRQTVIWFPDASGERYSVSYGTQVLVVCNTELECKVQASHLCWL